MSKKRIAQRCVRCGHALAPSSAKCRACGAWQIDHTLVKADDGTLLLSEVEPKPVRRIKTGLIDHVISNDESGIVETATLLLGGAPGAGKSTMALQLAHNLSESANSEVLYVASEETAEDIGERARRLRCNLTRIRVYPCNNESDLRSVIVNRKPCAVIVDSVNDLVGEPELVAPFAAGMRALAHELKFPVILIAHVTKELDFAGFMADQHTVDCTLSLFAEDDSELRQMNVHKNRHGKANTTHAFMMSETGLEAVPDNDDEDDML